MEVLANSPVFRKDPFNVANVILAIIVILAVLVCIFFAGLLILSQKFDGSKRLYDVLTLLLLACVVSFVIMPFVTASQLFMERSSGARYLEWVLTTPLLVLAAIYYMNYLNAGTGSTLEGWKIALVVVLFEVAVILGFIGSFTSGQDRNTWNFLGLLFLIAGLLVMGYFYLKTNSAWFFWAFVIIHVLYAATYFIEERYQGFIFNLLDGIYRVGFTFIVCMPIINKF